MHAELIGTYRLQLSAGFDLSDAASIVPYLAELGVSHVYLSPVLQAAADSTHGYDVADTTQVSRDLGGKTGMQGLFAALSSHGMAAIIDTVPNHMSATPDNPWWWDVLRLGKASQYAEFFDIDWNPPDPELRNRILVPILGDHLGEVLDRGEISVVRDGTAEPQLAYFAHRLPIHPDTWSVMDIDKVDVASLLDMQAYRLAYWRSAAEEINYRRFFDITTLVGLRTENHRVMEATHQRLFDLIDEGPVDGLRIDHPDGLADPKAYFQALRQRLPHHWLIVEKILEPGERLRPDWEVDGTTGYDFIQRTGGLLISSSGEKSISDFYTDFTQHSEPYGTLVRNKKREVLEQSFDGDLRRLVEILRAICSHPAIRRDHSRRQLRTALVEIIAGFPVYRSYVKPDRSEISDDDREAINQAISSARRRPLSIDPGLIDFIESLLTGELSVGDSSPEFITRFQQLTSPVMAKGVEDTTFYCYDRLLALNEVGCDPARFGVSPAAYHETCTRIHKDWPRTMLSSSTHDTKRSEDVRARIALLSEIPDEWANAVRNWSEHNLLAWSGREPDRNAEHLLYQTLVGAWPIETDRITAYMEKACREAKTYTSWTDPDTSYEHRIAEFVKTVLGDREFVRMLDDFIAPLILPGRINALSQTLLKLTTPGIPDIYQGCELWDNSLVDPDNRRPVSFATRQALLRELNAKSIDPMERSDEGLPKLHLIHKALTLRRTLPEAFSPGASGAYTPLVVTGQKLGHVVAFKRGVRVAVVAPVLPLGVRDGWHDTKVDLGKGTWHDVLDGEIYSGSAGLSDLTAKFPVSLLMRAE
jgi:(1->4)-alpha-D-glucan 1-alpha-D-glucosylmutase